MKQFYQRRNMYHRCAWGVERDGSMVRCDRKTTACWTTKDKRTGKIIDVPVCEFHDKWIRANNPKVEDSGIGRHGNAMLVKDENVVMPRETFEALDKTITGRTMSKPNIQDPNWERPE